MGHLILDGTPVHFDGQNLYVKVPFTDGDYLLSHQVKSCPVIIEDGRQLTAQQRKYIYAMLRDISFHTGHEPEFLKELFKLDVIARSDGRWFSLSDCSVTTANDMIDVLIQFCIEWQVPTRDNIAEFAPDFNKYLYYCLKNKVCCISRKSGAELHHVDHVGIGRDRNEIPHLGLRAMPLLRQYHDEAHRIGQESFEDKYHIHGIPLTEELCAVWRVSANGKGG